VIALQTHLISLLSTPFVVMCSLVVLLKVPVKKNCGDISMSLGERLKEARRLVGMGQTELAKCAGISQSAISNLEMRGSQSSQHTQTLADCLGVNIRWLATGEGEPKSTEKVDHAIISVPVISWVQAGAWTEIAEFVAVDERIPWAVKVKDKEKRMFALKVSGVSMEPDFKDGDTILIDPARQPENGDYVVVRLKDENAATFKQLVLEGDQKFLKALNPIWTPQVQKINGDADLIGVVKAKQTLF